MLQLPKLRLSFGSDVSILGVGTGLHVSFAGSVYCGGEALKLETTWFQFQYLEKPGL